MPTASIDGLPGLLTLEKVVGAALQAFKAGNLAEFVGARPRAVRWAARRHLRPIIGVLDGSPHDRTSLALPTEILLRWALNRLRPDRAGIQVAIAREAWLDRTSWRPLLAVGCHYGLLEVPLFPDRYRRRSDESPAENLCGLWNVGPSTFYRYLEKGKRLVAEVLDAYPWDGESMVGLRDFALGCLPSRTTSDLDAPRRWHATRADRALEARDPRSALWHLLEIGDIDSSVDLMHRYKTELAADSEAQALMDRCASRASTVKQRFDISMTRAELWQHIHADQRALQALEAGLHLANGAQDKLMLGVVYGALGKHFESRDTDRALACLEESASFLWQAVEGNEGPEIGVLQNEYAGSLQKLSWFHLLRNDPRAKTVLDRADKLRQSAKLREETIALIEQAWGEYWRRSGSPQRAAEYHHRALNIFERLRDTRQLLSTYNNLSLIYIEAKDFQRAILHAQRVVSASQSLAVDPYITTSALGNLGIAYFWLGRYDDAIASYQEGLQQSLRAKLMVIANRARYNLAEAYFKRFRISGNADDERLGDHYIAEVMKARPSERDSLFEEAAPMLKAEILGPGDGHVLERMWPEESAAHYFELAQVQKHRSSLALPSAARDRIRAHLAIANAYLAISIKERTTAITLMQQHGLDSEFSAEVDALQMTFSREITRERALLAQWKQSIAGLMPETRIAAILDHVLSDGSINKSRYAQLCEVGPATASKHLVALAERGLLQQVGRGPTTRYVLPAEAAVGLGAGGASASRPS